jgi:hypothetical protein
MIIKRRDNEGKTTGMVTSFWMGKYSEQKGNNLGAA